VHRPSCAVRGSSTPLAWRVAGVVELLLAATVLIVSVAETDLARFVVGLVIAVGFGIMAGGLLTGRVWAYWPSAAVLALFLASKAIGNHALGSAVASGLLIATLVGLFLPSSRRVRMRVESLEDQEAMRTAG
jgi:hypothetical protein